MVVVSLDMFLNDTQDTFVKHKNEKFYLVKGNRNSGKTIAIIFKLLNLKRNYCFNSNDKILFITSSEEWSKVVDIFNYINKSNLYESIIPSDKVEVHILTYEQFESLNLGKFYTHIIIDNIENFEISHIKRVFKSFKKSFYSKVYFVQNTLENLNTLSPILDYSKKIIGVKECVFRFRYVIHDDDRDEFTQITIMPQIKYDGYLYKEYVDFDSKKISGFYQNENLLCVDKGTFLQNLTDECFEIDFINERLEKVSSINVLSSWTCFSKDLKFIEINDEGMAKYDLFRGDKVLIDTSFEINTKDVLVILKSGYVYARKIVKDEFNNLFFVSSESIFKEITMDNDVKILGKVVGYIREH